MENTIIITAPAIKDNRGAFHHRGPAPQARTGRDVRGGCLALGIGDQPGSRRNELPEVGAEPFVWKVQEVAHHLFLPQTRGSRDFLSQTGPAL